MGIEKRQKVVIAIITLSVSVIVSLQAITVGICFNFFPTIVAGIMLFTLTFYWLWKLYRG